MADEFEAGGAADPVDPSPAWTPSPAAADRLAAGVWAALAVGGLSLASGATHAGPNPGVDVSTALGWAALVPLVWVVRAYAAVAAEAATPGLRKSAVGVLAASALGAAAGLADLPGLPRWGAVVILIAAAVGLVVLLVGLFSAGEEKPDAPTGEEPAKPAEGDGVSSSAAGGCAAGAGVGLVVLLKFGAKVLVWFGIKNMGFDLFRGAVEFALLVALAGFVIWFAAVKIRLRHRLGGAVAVVGWAEVLLLVAGVGLLAAVLVAAVAAEDAGKNAEDEIDGWLPAVALASGVGALVWGALTAWLFAALRRPPAADALPFD